MPYTVEKKAYQLYACTDNRLLPSPHIHTHLELVYLSSGSSRATVDGTDYLIEAGDFFLVFPHQIHFYHDTSPIHMYLLIFSVDFCKELTDIFQNMIPSCPLIKSRDIHTDTEQRLKRIVRNAGSASDFDRICAKGYLLSLLGELLPLMTLVPNSSQQDSIKNVLTYCSLHYTDPLTLDTLAKELHMSKYYISRIFKDRVNMSFRDFLNRLRTEHACSLLEKDKSITEVAYASGFSSIRTFNRVFVQNTGISPREYIKHKETNNGH